MGGSGRTDTLCYATQVNQDALALALGEPLDAAFVIGGRNSSNTYQLYRLCAERLAATEADLFVLEGVGGLMSPLADGATGLDLMLALRLPVVLVGGSYLGAMSHTLTALEVLRARGQAVACVVVSQDGQPDAPDFAASLALVAEHAGPTPVMGAPRGEVGDWAAQTLALLPRPQSASA